MYCGKRAHINETDIVDDKSRPAAALRNLMKVVPAVRDHAYFVGMDRFYTFIPLFLELLARKLYAVGTIITNRIGFPAALKESRKKRPKKIQRGLYCVVKSNDVPEMLACCWWDNKPVHFLATGSSMQHLTIERRTRQTKEKVPCPKLVVDYQTNMGGVDVFDQLRLQRYSVQLAHRFQKYYKSLALGLFDCALVNAFIVYREHHKKLQTKSIDHGEFMMALQRHLIGLTKETFPPQNAAPDCDTRYRIAPVRRSVDIESHEMSLTEDFHDTTANQPRKRISRMCKVWSILSPPGKRGASTSTLCKLCSLSLSGDVYLCPKARHPTFGVTKSCFQIWHQDWNGGKSLPDGSSQKIRWRPPTGKKRKRTSTELSQE